MIYEINDNIEFKSDKGDLVLFVSDKEIARDKLSTASMQIDYKVFNMLYEYLTSNDGYEGVGYFSGTLKESLEMYHTQPAHKQQYKLLKNFFVY